MSSDHLWKPIVTTHFPSLSTLPLAAVVSYRHLFAVGHSAATRRRNMPSKPTLSLADLIFTVSISTRGNSRVVAAAAKPGDTLVADPPGVFRFGFGCDAAKSEGLLVEDQVKVKVTWNVVVNGWRGVFTMMECEGKVGFVLGGGEGWFTEELPAPGCCSKAVAGSLVAELRVGMGGGTGDGKKVSLSVGIMSVVDWRYLGVEDGLRYLQHFLLT